MVAKLLTDGTLDGRFGDGGTVVSAFPTGADGRGVAIDADGNIVVAGASFDAGGVERGAADKFVVDKCEVEEA